MFYHSFYQDIAELKFLLTKDELQYSNVRYIHLINLFIQIY